MDSSHVEHDLVNILFTEAQIQQRLGEMALQITEDYEGRDLLVVGVLRATNTWDFPTYTLAALAGLGVLEGVRRQAMARPADLTGWLAFLFRTAVSVVWPARLVTASMNLRANSWCSEDSSAAIG